jgi:hypothetical protein
LSILTLGDNCNTTHPANSTTAMKKFKNWKGLFYGISYGLVSRTIFALEDFRGDNPNPVFPTFGLMTAAFMFIVPFVAGLIVAYYNDTKS